MGNMKPTKVKKVKTKPKPRYSPSKAGSRCAGKCRHQWCLGYDAGYLDGEADA